MSPLAEIQRDFVAAIRDRALPPPADVVGRGSEVPARRFGVYRNNVHVSLVEALAATYPVVARLVGDEFFQAMARVHVGASLPRTPVLIDYGDDFPAFVAGFGPAGSLPYLPDVARLEWAWHRAYHAADRVPLEAGAFAAIAPERLADLTLALHPSLAVVASPWPVLAIWETNTNDPEVKPVDLAAGGDAVLVLRPHLDVELRRLPPGGATFIAALEAGDPLGAAFEQAQAVADAFDLAANLHGLIGSGAVVGFGNPDADPAA